MSVQKFFRDMFSDQRGIVSVEMALVTLILSALLFGGVEIARYALLRYHLDRATYYAARYLTLNLNETDAARTMVRTEVERNVGSSVGNVELYVKNVRRDDQCLLVVETRAQYLSAQLNWLIPDASAESSQVWHQAGGCAQFVAQTKPVNSAPTPTPTPILISTPAPRVALAQSEGTAMVNANIRLGPGFEYAIVGRLSEKEVVQVRGRDGTGTWLQIASERVGWVYAPLIQMGAPVSSLQVIVSPPIPSTTPMPLSRLRFDVEPKVLKVGECAWLRWAADDAVFVTLNEKNVSLQGAQQVCPTTDTKYVLSAGYADSRFFDREVKILIYPASDP